MIQVNSKVWCNTLAIVGLSSIQILQTLECRFYREVQHKSRIEFNPDSTESRVKILQTPECRFYSVPSAFCHRPNLSAASFITTIAHLAILKWILWILCKLRCTLRILLIQLLCIVMFCIFVRVVNCKMYPHWTNYLHIVDFVQTPNCVTSFLCSPVIQMAAATVHCEQVNKWTSVYIGHFVQCAIWYTKSTLWSTLVSVNCSRCSKCA